MRYLTLYYNVRDARCTRGWRVKKKRYEGENIDSYAVGTAALFDPKRVSTTATVVVDGNAFTWRLTEPASWCLTKAGLEAYIEMRNEAKGDNKNG